MGEVVSGLGLAVVVVVRRDEGRFLLIQRAKGLPAAGYWTPVSGRPLERESLAEAAAREVHEEVGLRVVVGEEFLRCPAEGGAPFLLVWFHACPASDVACDTLVLDPAEVAQALWLSPSEAAQRSPMFAVTRRVFESLAAAQTPR